MQPCVAPRPLRRSSSLSSQRSCQHQPSVAACGVPPAVAAVRLDDLQAVFTALPSDGHLEELPAAMPSAECAPGCIPESALVLPFAETVLVAGAFALTVFITASAAEGASGIRGMADMGLPDTATQVTTIRTGGGTRLPRTTMTRSGNLRWPTR